MASYEIDSETRSQLHSLLVDVWEGITTISPEYRDAALPQLKVTTEKMEDRMACYTPPQPDDLLFPLIRLKPEYATLEAAGPILAHELIHHLQYLRGEGGYGSWGQWRHFDPNEQEADQMVLALYWDDEPGERWRKLETWEEEPEDRPDNTEWLRNLHENAEARRMLWERLEKSLAQELGAREAEGNEGGC